MAWFRVAGLPKFVNSDSGISADVVVNDSLYRLRVNGQQLAGAGHATEQEAVDRLEEILQAYTLN